MSSQSQDIAIWEGDVLHEILPPQQPLPVTLSVPDLSDYRSKIIDALSIPPDLMAGRTVSIEIKFAVIPAGIVTKIINT